MLNRAESYESFPPEALLNKFLMDKQKGKVRRYEVN